MRDGIWAVMRHQRRDYIWLAGRTGYSHSHIKGIATGKYPPSAEFRAKCAIALDIPEDLLFHLAPASEPTEANVA